MTISGLGCAVCGGNSCACSGRGTLRTAIPRAVLHVRRVPRGGETVQQAADKSKPRGDDGFEFSPAGRTLLAAAKLKAAKDSRSAARPPNAELSAEDRARLEALKQRDQEVKAHEQAHLAAAGRYARGGASYTYEVGPDGRQYAVGGEVPIDVSEVPDDPLATIEKAGIVARAALAPADPSGADRAIAAKAAALAAKARQELMQKQNDAGVSPARSASDTETPSVGGQGEGTKGAAPRRTPAVDVRSALQSYRHPPQTPVFFESVA